MDAEGEIIAGTKPTMDAATGEDERDGQSKVQEKMGNPALMLSREDVGLLGITAVSVVYLGDPSAANIYPYVRRQAISWTVRRHPSMASLERS